MYDVGSEGSLVWLVYYFCFSYIGEVLIAMATFVDNSNIS